MDISKLRELIRTGEYIEENRKDGKTGNKWIFDIENFILSLDKSIQSRVSSQISNLKSFNWDSTFSRSSFDLVMGFFRSLYNNDSLENKYISLDSQAVFIVHGHDDSLIENVKKCISELGLSPIVLREQPNNGLTIIEKLEACLGNCKCAVVLYTPCDLGKAANEADTEARARQNVVYEHGLFQGYLGRKRILVLRKGNTNLPGDCSGVVYTSVDFDDWQHQLMKNIRAIDM